MALIERELVIIELKNVFNSEEKKDTPAFAEGWEDGINAALDAVNKIPDADLSDLLNELDIYTPKCPICNYGKMHIKGLNGSISAVCERDNTRLYKRRDGGGWAGSIRCSDEYRLVTVRRKLFERKDPPMQYSLNCEGGDYIVHFVLTDKTGWANT